MPDKESLARKYLITATHLSNELERILQGKVRKIPKSYIDSALRLLESAHSAFFYDGFLVERPVPGQSVTALAARILVSDSYGKATGQYFQDLDTGERKISELIDLTNRLGLIGDTLPRPEESYRELQKFYSELKKIGESLDPSYRSKPDSHAIRA